MAIEHNTLHAGANQHGIHRWSVADQTARFGLSVVSGDKGKVAYQTGDNTFWALIDNTQVGNVAGWTQLNINNAADALADASLATFGQMNRLPAKKSAHARTTAALAANTYANGSSGVGATLTANANGALAAQDGQTLVAGSTLLVNNEAAGANNGLYTVTQVGDGSNPYILTRSKDADTAAKLRGLTVYVIKGTTHTNTVWGLPLLDTDITVGSTALSFSAVAVPAQTSDMQTIGTAASAGTSTKYMRADAVLAHGNQTVDTLHALATASAHGFADKADKQFRDRLFNDGLASADVCFDDFDNAGDFAASAAAVANAHLVGRLGWRAGFSGTGAAATLVTTNQDSTTFGVIELDCGTTNTGTSTINTAAATTVPHITVGSNQQFSYKFRVRIPTLSTSSERYIARFGWGGPVNGVYFEYDESISANWRGCTTASSTTTVASGGTPTAVAAGAWIQLTMTWDGTTASFYVDGVLIGTSTTNIPTGTSVNRIASITKSVGTTARQVRVDYYWQKLVWTTPRAA